MAQNDDGRMIASQNEIVAYIRGLDPDFTGFDALDRFVELNPQWDAGIAKALRESGFLQLWRIEQDANPWHYDAALMETVAGISSTDVRGHCISVLRTAFTAGLDLAERLTRYEQNFKWMRRESFALLSNLYRTLVLKDRQRREAAREWLLAHHPKDVAENFERIEPHSELWFRIVDRAEPGLGRLARAQIEAEEDPRVCFNCARKPARDYLILRAVVAPSDVPSVRLCETCHGIRSGHREWLEPMTPSTASALMRIFGRSPLAERPRSSVFRSR